MGLFRGILEHFGTIEDLFGDFRDFLGSMGFSPRPEISPMRTSSSASSSRRHPRSSSSRFTRFFVWSLEGIFCLGS